MGVSACCRTSCSVAWAIIRAGEARWACSALKKTARVAGTQSCWLGRLGAARLDPVRWAAAACGDCRALCQRAKVILADEPIASLDPESARKVMQILADINREDGTTVVVTLHQVDYAMRYCQRAVALKAGVFISMAPPPSCTPNFLNDLYGAELEVEPLPIEKARRARTPKVPLALAKA